MARSGNFAARAYVYVARRAAVREGLEEHSLSAVSMN